MAQTKTDAQQRQSTILPRQMPNPEGRKEDCLQIHHHPLGLMNLRNSQDVNKIMSRYFGTALPEGPNTFSVSGNRRALWLGPDESLLICEDQDSAELHRTLSTQLSCQHFQLTLLSDALAVYELNGPYVREILAKGCALDLHVSVFQPGQCAQSSLDRVAVVLMCEAVTSFRLICRTSFADYVETWLKDAAIEYGYMVR
ncbi:MAG: sarcosine oxidase subunit gamma [Rhodospirillaceae bacterium]|nr:sarcosine oxidase subunit gamma [Rhodospirillaceae bacterium]